MKRQISGTKQSRRDPRSSTGKNPDLLLQLSPALLDTLGEGCDEVEEKMSFSWLSKLKS